MTLYNLPSGDSCTNVTVYSECNTDRAEVGSYSSSGTDSNGYSIFTSDDGSLYKIYYDSSSSVMITFQYIKVNLLFSKFNCVTGLGYWYGWQQFNCYI